MKIARVRVTPGRALAHLSLLASLSLSRRARMSPFLTGPFTFLTKLLVGLFTNTTFTCVIPPLEPNRRSAHIEAARPADAILTSLANDLLDGGVRDFTLVIHFDLSLWD